MNDDSKELIDVSNNKERPLGISEEIHYSKLIQRNGLKEDLYKLDVAELGVATDTGQVYVGLEPSQNTYLKPTRVMLDPIPNVQNYVQYLLDSNPNYTRMYSVTDDLTIETESNDKAIELINFINTETKKEYPNVHSIARISNLVEFVTSLNISDYTNPAFDNVTYNPVVGYSKPSKRLLAKLLTVESGNVFIEFNRSDVNYIEIEYSLVQNSARGHKRSGKMTITADRHILNASELGFIDEQVLMTPSVGTDHIRFNAIYDRDKIIVLFEQPTDYKTRIFYRITRWAMDQATNFTEPYYYSDSSVSELFVNNRKLGFNENSAGAVTKDLGEDNE